MSETRHKYVIRLSAEGGEQVKAALVKMGADGKQALQVIEQGTVAADSRFTMLQRTILTRLVPALSAGALLGAVRSAINELSNLNDAAEKLGITAERLQTVRFIGRDAGLQDGQTDSALSHFAAQVGAAQNGLGKLLPVLKAYHIELKTADGAARSQSEILADLTRVLEGASSAEDRLFISTRAFGEENAALGNALVKTGGNLDDYQAKLKGTGQIVDEQLVKSADQFDKEWEKALNHWSVMWKSTIVDILGALDPLLHNVGALSAEMGKGLRGGSINPAVLRGVEDPGFDVIPPGSIERMLAYKGNKGGSVSIAEEIKRQEEAARAAEKHAEKLKAVIEALQFRDEQLGRSARQQELYNQLHAAGVELYSKEGQQIAALVDRYMDFTEVQELEKIASEEVKREWEEQRKAAERMGSAIDDLITNFDDLRSVALHALGDIAKSLMQLSAGGEATNSLGGFLGETIFGLFSGGEAHSLGGSLAESFAFPGRASGGPVEAGTLYRVNEMQQEWFRPSTGGDVIPLGPSRGGGITIEYIDARGTNPEAIDNMMDQLRTLDAKVNKVNRSVEPRAVMAMQNNKKRKLGG